MARPLEQAPVLAQRMVTERGVTIRYAEDEVNLALRLLALNGGSYKPTVDQLASEGLQMTRETLRHWRDNAFPRRYYELRRELGRDVGEELAGRAFERAMQADQAEQEYIDKAIEKMDRVPPAHLAKSALALAQAKALNVQNSQLLRDRPTEIRETRGVDDLIGTLERLKVVKKPEVIDVDSEEIPV